MFRRDTTVWPRPSSSLCEAARRCVIRRAPLSWPHGITQDHPFSFNKCYLCSRLTLLPMFPVAHVHQVIDGPNDIPPRYLPRSERMRVSGMASRPIPHPISRMDNSGARPTNRSRFVMWGWEIVSYFLAVARLVS